MVQSGSEVLNYTGNAALGLNESGTTTSYGETDLKDLNASLFNLAYLNMQKNKVVYEQKLKERDDTMSKIAADEINIGTVLPDHMPDMIAKRDDIKKFYIDNVGDLKSNPNKWLEFNNKIADFKQAKTVAQSKYIEANKEMQAAAKETNPIVRQKMIDNVNNNKRSPLLSLYNPFQQQIDFDPNGIFMDLPTTTVKDYYSGPERVQEIATDVRGAREMFNRMYVYNQDYRLQEPVSNVETAKGDRTTSKASVMDPAVNMDIFAEKWLGQDGLRPEAVIIGTDGQGGDVAIVNRRLDEINKKNGAKPGDINFVEPLQVGKGPDGKLHFAELKPDAVFKIALAAKYQRGENRTLDLNKVKAQTELSKQSANYALAEQRRTGAQLNQAKTAKTSMQTKAIQKEAVQVEENWNELAQKSYSLPTKAGNLMTRVDASEISKKTRDYIGIDPLTDEKGREFFNMVPANVKIGNKIYTEREVQKLFNQVKDKQVVVNGEKRNFKSVFDYLNFARAAYEPEIVGRTKPLINEKTGAKVPNTGGKITRANKLTVWQAQAQANKNPKLYMNEGDEAPAVEQPTLPED